MNYQKIICLGDSQTFGARTYGCYPLYLAQMLDSRTRYMWQAINFSTNGHTARDLWFRVGQELNYVKDVHQACILIGTNDVGNSTPEELFEEYYRQILNALRINHFRSVFCGEIPPIWPDGHAFFSSETKDRRNTYNIAIKRCVESSSIARLVEFPTLSSECFVDPIHFHESGNKAVALAFADAITAF
jgi:lysophospholipase L1-like esterase